MHDVILIMVCKYATIFLHYSTHLFIYGQKYTFLNAYLLCIAFYCVCVCMWLPTQCLYCSKWPQSVFQSVQTRQPYTPHLLLSHRPDHKTDSVPFVQYNERGWLCLVMLWMYGLFEPFWDCTYWIEFCRKWFQSRLRCKQIWKRREIRLPGTVTSQIYCLCRKESKSSIQVEAIAPNLSLLFHAFLFTLLALWPTALRYTLKIVFVKRKRNWRLS